MTPVEILGWSANGLGIISFVPQCYKVYKTNDTKSLSVLMFIIITMSFLLWIVYGYEIKSRPIMYGNIVTFILSMYILVKKLQNSSKDNNKRDR